MKFKTGDMVKVKDRDDQLSKDHDNVEFLQNHYGNIYEVNRILVGDDTPLVLNTPSGLEYFNFEEVTLVSPLLDLGGIYGNL